MRGSLPLICNLAGGDNIVLDGKNTGVASQAGSQHTLAASVESNVDYVLTFEEIGAMFVGAGIEIGKLYAAFLW